MLKNAFKTCGLCPFNPNAIRFDKLVTNPLTQGADNTIENRVEKRCDFNNEQVDVIENLIGTEKIVNFKNCQGSSNWNGATEDTSLFEFWCNWSKYLNNRENKNQDEIVMEVEEGNDYSYLDDDNLLSEAKRIEEELNKEKPWEKKVGNSVNETLMENVCSGVIENQVETVTIENIEIEIMDQDQLLFNKNKTYAPEERNKESPIKTIDIPNPKINIISDIVLNETFVPISAAATTMTPTITKSNVLPDVPSPFKTILFWPNVQKSDKKRNSKEKLPSVASSEQWQDYCRKKEEKKRNEEKEKERRKKLREEKLEQKVKKPKVMKSKILKERVKRRVFHSGSDGSRQSIESSAPNCEQQYNIDDYVVVKYDDIKYPGIIKDLRENEAFVSVMAPSGCSWKWPQKEDCIWYELSEITEKINPPTLNNNRGTYSVPEMKKYLRSTD